MSFSPRFFRSVRHDNQNLAPSVSLSQSPRSSLCPCIFTPRATYIVWGNTRPFSLPHMHHDAIEIDDRPDGMEARRLRHDEYFWSIEISGDFRDQGRRHIDVVEFFHNFLDVPCGHPLGI